MLPHLADKNSRYLVTFEFQVNSDSKHILCNIKIQFFTGEHCILSGKSTVAVHLQSTYAMRLL